MKKKILILICLCILMCSCQKKYSVDNSIDYTKKYTVNDIKGKYILQNSFIINKGITHNIENLTKDTFEINDKLKYCYENNDECYNLEYKLVGNNNEYIYVNVDNDEVNHYYKILFCEGNKLITVYEDGTYRIYYFFERDLS